MDLVEVLNLGADPPPAGITRTVGMCARRKGRGNNSNETTTEDVAYKISDRAVASVPTARIFPGDDISHNSKKLFFN